MTGLLMESLLHKFSGNPYEMEGFEECIHEDPDVYISNILLSNTQSEICIFLDMATRRISFYNEINSQSPRHPR